MSAQTHRSNPQILRRRTLERDHRRLPGLLRHGLNVLDLGCGTGSITAGIARAVGTDGFVLGIDRDEGLLSIGREQYASLPNLGFLQADVLSLSRAQLAEMGFVSEFDIVTSARMIQWISEPLVALANMKALAKPSGKLIVLDYDHTLNGWEPDPPKEFQTAWKAFLNWREAHGWENRTGSRLPEMFEAVGLQDVESHVEDEIATRDEEDFGEVSLIWLRTLESLGGRLVSEGFLSQDELEAALQAYRPWIASDMSRQRLCLRAVTGCPTV